MDFLRTFNFIIDTHKSSPVDAEDKDPVFIHAYREQNKVLATEQIIKEPKGFLAQAALKQRDFAMERRKKKMIRLKLQGLLSMSQPEVEQRTETPVSEDLDSGQQSKDSEEESGVFDHSSIDRESLPIYKLKDELIKAVSENQFLIVLGETGSGKSTQITQFLAEAGFAERGKICCTQPRRVAVMSIAQRVADELGCTIGDKVGYAMRFENCTSPKTIIKYVTEGILLRECIAHPELRAYNVIMLDEAHERTIYTDVLFGILKIIAKRRKNLKIIVTSATLNASKFSEYFDEAPIFKIPGRTFDVKINYLKAPELDYIEAALTTVVLIHQQEPPGDILLFLTGQQEIEEVCDLLQTRLELLGPKVSEFMILPAYTTLSSSQLSRIFDPTPPGCRKIIVATNMAETSITINGIYYVVDTGLAKQLVFNAKTETNCLVMGPISQASAMQRAGRAGRTGPGICFRLYTEDAFENEMWPTSIPEIKRLNFSNTLLQLLAIDLNQLTAKDFMDFPSADLMLHALKTLYRLRAVDDQGMITDLGKIMALFPLEPCLAKMLIISILFKCSEEILTIVSIFSVIDSFQSVFDFPPSDKEKLADLEYNRKKFINCDGDHLTFLATYNAWVENDCAEKWCSRNYVNFVVLEGAQKIREQLVRIMESLSFNIVSSEKNMEPVKLAICSGLLRNVAKMEGIFIKGYYITLTSKQKVFIHPSSVLVKKRAKYIVYQDLLSNQNQKICMKYVTAIKPQWINAFDNFSLSQVDWFNIP